MALYWFIRLWRTISRICTHGGDDGAQTHDLSGANRMLSRLSYVPICINGKYFLSRATTVVFKPTVDYIAVLSLIRRQLAGVCGGTLTHKPFRTPRFGPGRV